MPLSRVPPEQVSILLGQARGRSDRVEEVFAQPSDQLRLSGPPLP